MTTGHVRSEMLSALIVTLPKAGKNPDTPENFRPISLLNSDLKIFAKILANRLVDILPLLVSSDQVGFIKQRQTSDGTRRFIDILEVVAHRRTPSLLLSLDAEKAFDRVHWGFLRAVLGKFGFSGSFLTAIMALYSSPNAAVYSSGFLSKSFTITNGTRQGCPMSPLIFALIMEPFAEHIRSSPHISGIPIQTTDHRIGLFADDVILALSNPIESLPHVMDIINAFSFSSYYKINNSKSQILNMGLSPSHSRLLKQKYNFHWVKKSLPYLGIHLTFPPSRLFDSNYSPLLKDLQATIASLQTQGVSWMGRIAIAKMFILPKMLYYFRNVPIPLPISYLQKLQCLISRFIWANKRPRVGADILYSPISAGGLSCPSVIQYYRATILSQLRSLHNKDFSKAWVHIENYYLKNHNIYNFLHFSYNTSSNLQPFMPSTIQAFGMLWRQSFVRTQVACPEPSATPMTILELFLSNISLSSWASLGLVYFSDFFINNSTPSFSSLHQKFGIPNSDFYKFLQIRHLIESSELFSNITTSFSTLNIWLTRPTPNTSSKCISTCYKILLSLKPDPLSSIKDAWQRELNIQISEDSWKSAFIAVSKASKCINHLESARKVLYNWYLTPYRLSKIFPDSPDVCWRCGLATGTLIHLMWECNRVNALWIKIFQVLTNICHLPIAPDPALALLSLNIQLFPLEYRTIIMHFCIVTRQRIASFWKDTHVVHISNIIQGVNESCWYERMSASALGQHPTFNSKWSPWLSSPLYKG